MNPLQDRKLRDLFRKSMFVHPLVEIRRCRLKGVRVPYHWIIDAASGWTITYGINQRLIARGSGFSRGPGRALYNMLTTVERDPPPRPKRKQKPRR
jgi:hypothetical protein